MLDPGLPPIHCQLYKCSVCGSGEYYSTGALPPGWIRSGSKIICTDCIDLTTRPPKKDGRGAPPGPKSDSCGIAILADLYTSRGRSRKFLQGLTNVSYSAFRGALFRLQNNGFIRKMGNGRYDITTKGRAWFLQNGSGSENERTVSDGNC